MEIVPFVNIPQEHQIKILKKQNNINNNNNNNNLRWEIFREVSPDSNI